MRRARKKNGNRMEGSAEIYDCILNKIRGLIEQIQQNCDSQEPSLQSAAKEACAILTEQQRKISEEYDALKRYTEWKTFTVAFYGETNSGKSTLIETLRIRFHERTKKVAETKFRNIQRKCRDTAELMPYRDGQIIGDGRSDFTRTNTIYHFSVQGQPFDLIDVPGIEGDEDKVKESIMEAVRKAHLVFYVTRKPAAPQSVDGKTGTLEKIGQQLGAQTEVWTIFNQSVNTPRKLEAALVDNDTQASLDEMHEVLTEKLGADHYKGEIVLSALPAFLAAATCLVPGTSEHRKREKFLQAYSAEDILRRSGMQAFLKRLPQELIGEWQGKILRSNYHKAQVALDETIAQLEKLQKNTFKPLMQKVKRSYDDTRNELEELKNGFRRDFRNEIDSLINRFSFTVQERVYGEIKKNISNDAFTSTLQRKLEAGGRELQSDIEKAYRRRLNDFAAAVQEKIDKSMRRMDDLLQASLDIPELKMLELKIDIKSGVDGRSMINTALGFKALLSITNPVVFFLTFVATACVAIKAVLSWLSDDYKKAQQRRAADENIDKNADEIRRKIYDNWSDFFPQAQVDRCLNDCKQLLAQPYDVLKSINGILRDSVDELRKLSQSVERMMQDVE